MPYAQPDPELVHQKLFLIDQRATEVPVPAEQAPQQLKWWLGHGANHVTEAHMACETTGPVDPAALEHLANAVLQHAARTLAALRSYTATNPGVNVVSPTRDRLSSLVDDFATSRSSAAYHEDELGMHADQVLLEQFIPSINAGSPNVTLRDPGPERLNELALRAIAAAADFLAAYEQRPEYTDPYA